MSTLRADAILDASGGNTATINGKLPIALGDVPAPTTAQVLAANAGLTLGAIGSYGFFSLAATLAEGGTVAGSSLLWASVASGGTFTGAAPSGTWRILGSNSGTRCSLYVRIA